MRTNLRQKLGTCAVVLLITVFFIPTYAGAFRPGDSKPVKGFGMKRHHISTCRLWRDPRIVQDLGITDEQIKGLRDADFAFREKELKLKSQLDGLRLKMEKAFSDETVVESDVLELAQKISDVKGKMFIQDIESRLALKKILNADQIKKLRQHEMHPRKQGPMPGEKRITGGHKMERPDDKKPFEN